MSTQLHNLTTPLSNEQIAEYESSLQSLQANILKSHGRHHVALIFVRFDPDLLANALKSGIGTISQALTSAVNQRSQAAHRITAPNDFVRSFFLTWKGCERLGLVNGAQFGDLASQDVAPFREGMRQRAEMLGFADPSGWADPFKQSRGKEIHAMYLLANRDQCLLRRERDAIRNELQTFSTVLGIEEGNQKTNAAGQPIEHFQFRDGISEPLFFQSDMDKERQGGNVQWDASAGPNLVLVKDPLTGDPNAFGSFLVLQKLQEDLNKYADLETELADGLPATIPNSLRRELAGAMIFGRFRDGTPLTLSSLPVGLPSGLNNFDYEDDMPGRMMSVIPRCPFRAHIRKGNPRNDHTQGDDHRNRRIARRSVTFGGMPEPPGCAERPTENRVGVLFMCYQASIARQFEFVQKTWLNPNDFPFPQSGQDGLVGRGTSGGVDLEWKATWHPDNDRRQKDDIRVETSRAFKDVVKLLGGEYFFAPSVTFLKSLGTSPSP